MSGLGGLNKSTNGVVIGLVNHATSWLIGHGPGCMTLLSCPTPHIEPVVDAGANIARYMNCGAFSKGGTPKW